MIDKRLVPYSGLKKEPFSGSHNGMRYMMRSDNGRDSTTFTVFVYPEPWCFEQTPEDQIESHTFDLSEEGLDLAITWLWERFEAERDRWTQASQEIRHTVKKQTL